MESSISEREYLLLFLPPITVARNDWGDLKGMQRQQLAAGCSQLSQTDHNRLTEQACDFRLRYGKPNKYALVYSSASNRSRATVNSRLGNRTVGSSAKTLRAA